MEEKREKFKKFFTDPDWFYVEEMLYKYVEPMNSVLDIDTTQSADNVKGEVIARKLMYEKLTKFLQETGMFRRVMSKPTTSDFK